VACLSLPQFATSFRYQFKGPIKAASHETSNLTYYLKPTPKGAIPISFEWNQHTIDCGLLCKASSTDFDAYTRKYILDTPICIVDTRRQTSGQDEEFNLVALLMSCH